MMRAMEKVLLHPVRTMLMLAVVVLANQSMACQAHATELLMFESPGCPYCARWRAEVGQAYARSAVGRRAPLRNVALDHPNDADVALQSPVVVSPTFVLADNGREIGRIVGYPGEDFFWGFLDNLIRKLDRPK